MAKLEKVKCEMLPQLLLWKYPKTLFKKSVELTVENGYAAVVYTDGQSSLVQPGKETLALEDKKAGLSAEIYFVRTENSNRYRWGTKPRIEMRDPVYNVPLRLTGYGTAAVAIQNPVMLVQNAKNGKFPKTGDPLPDFFRDRCNQALKNSLTRFFGTNRISLLYASQYLQEIRSLMKDALNPLLSPLGLSTTGVIINSLEVVPDNNSMYVWNKICEDASRGQNEAAQRTEQTSANTYQPAQAYAPYSQTSQPAQTYAPYSQTSQPAQTYAPYSQTQQPAQTYAPYSQSQQPAQTYAPYSQSQQPAQAYAPYSQPQQPANVTPPPIQSDVQAPVQPEPMNFTAEPFVPDEVPTADTAAEPFAEQEAPIADAAPAEDMTVPENSEAPSAEEAPAPVEIPNAENAVAEPVPAEQFPVNAAAMPEINEIPAAVQDAAMGQAPEPQVMKYCPYCRTALYNDDRFCPACGRPIPTLNQ